jgi:hypothetical protein
MNWTGSGRNRWWPNLKQCPDIYIVGLGETSENLGGVPAETRTGNLHDARQKDYRLSQFGARKTGRNESYRRERRKERSIGEEEGAVYKRNKHVSVDTVTGGHHYCQYYEYDG